MAIGRIAGVIAITLLGWAGSANAQTNEVPAFLKRLSATTATAETLCVEFVQERHLALFEEPLRTAGVLIFQKPDAIRWETTEPYRSILVAAGGKAVQFEQTDSTWKRIDLSYMKSIPNFVSGMTLFLEGKFAESPEAYEFALRQEKDATVLVLKPRHKSAQQFISAFELQFGPDLGAGARQVVMRQPDGDWTVIRFTNQVANARLPEGTFDLQAPKDLGTVQKAVRDAKR